MNNPTFKIKAVLCSRWDEGHTYADCKLALCRGKQAKVILLKSVLHVSGCYDADYYVLSLRPGEA